MGKLVVIVGPTASGKSELAVKLAKKFGGEIVSADSRQVYKGLQIGSGQMSKKEMGGVPHHLLNVASPKSRFSVAQYQQRANKAIALIIRRKKFPILVGGSPLYIYAVLEGWDIPRVKPNLKLRKKFEKQSIGELFSRLKALDPRRARTIEQKNKRRLIRALEIVLSTGKPVPPLSKTYINTTPWYDIDTMIIGVKKSPQELGRRIKRRFLKMLQQGFLEEVKKLRKQGLSWKKIEGFGLEYRESSQYLQGKISKQEMIEKTIKATQDFAKRQMTWFKKDPRIHWVAHSNEAKHLLARFLG